MTLDITTPAFKEKGREAIADAHLQSALTKLRTGFGAMRANAIEGLPEFDEYRDAARDMKDHTLENLDYYLALYEKNATANGVTVHWASDAREARDIIGDLCKSVGARRISKGKSMISEEIDLNPYLEDLGYKVVETDLGEYIVQLADERPSHIVGPAIHKTVDQISDLFLENHAPLGKTKRLTNAPDLVGEAREVLREGYFETDVGITGANFLIAETGSMSIVTNEGNGDLTQGLSRTHIVLASLEKVVPSLDDMALVLRLLARSATGQEMAAYTSLTTGPRREGETDGPEAVHVVLVDNGRSAMLGTPLQDVLRCIRCGSCMNHCPVYGAVGGHAYGWVYPGPIGSVMTPAMIGIEQGRNLPNASTFCGRCQEVCPMRIPLPRMMRYWRSKEFEAKLTPGRQRMWLAMWAWLARRPAAYRFATGIAMRALRFLGGNRGRVGSAPLAGGWTDGRDLPTPQGPSFQSQWSARGGSRGRS